MSDITSVVTRPCGTGIDLADYDSLWDWPTNIQDDDADYARGLTAQNQQTNTLLAKNFGFEIPENATITDLSFTYIAKIDVESVYLMSIVRLYNTGFIGTNKGGVQLGVDWVSYISHGDADYWGVTLTPALINAAGFGLGLRAARAVPDYVYVQFVSCTVTYTTPSGRRRMGFMG